MTDPNRSIFRANAVRRYLEGREEAVLPRFVSPRVFLFLWVLFVLFLAGGFAAWSAQVPEYASGCAVVVDGKTRALPVRGAFAVVVFLPPQHLSRLHVGQMLHLTAGPSGERIRKPIVAVDPEISSPQGVEKRFGLRAGAAQAIRQPAAVAMARWQPVSEDLPPSAYVGSVYRADVEVGSRRVISFLPLVGRSFGE